MNRSFHFGLIAGFLANSVLIVTAAVLAGACHAEGGSPTAPSGFQTVGGSSGSLGACASQTYTISGVITAYLGGPLADVGIEVVPYPSGSGTSAKTDIEGRYSVCGPAASRVGLQIYRHGYATAFKYDLQGHDQAINLALREKFEVPVGGGTVNAVIRGDEFEAGDDYFGGMCVRAACKIVDFSYSGCPCPTRSAEITLRWADASSHLAVYFSNADLYFPPPSVPPATRYCCSSPVVATYTFNADFDRFAIGFEQVAAGPPGPADSQAFELTVRPLP
jgi:hypothetical protein